MLLPAVVVAGAMPAVAEARQAPAAIVVDANTGRTLYADDADAARFPASLTKMMTLYVVFEELAAHRLEERDRITFSQRASARPPSKLGLKPGETLTVGEAIRALITKSANDVATAVAERISASEEAFARRMTHTARRLGMAHTTFRNASGLPDVNQVTTARDMATLGLALRDHFPARFRLFALRRFSFQGRTYKNHNRLLGRFAGIDGIKTGYTRASGFNIVTSLRRGNKHLIGVVIGRRTGRVRNRVMRHLLSKTLAKASTVRRRRPSRLVAVRPRLIQRPSLAARPAPVRPPVRPSAVATAVITEPSQTALPGIGRQPSTFATQLARLRQTHGAPPLTSPHLPPAPARHDLAARETHHIQVGAFFDAAEAERALQGARHRAGALLDGSRPLMLRVAGKPRTIYRARFAGFDRDEATATCAKLKRVSIDCFVASAR